MSEEELPSWEQLIETYQARFLEVYNAKCLAWAWDILEEAGFTVVPPPAGHPHNTTQGEQG